MNIVKVDQLSIAAQAGALDPALAYSQRLEETRGLIAQTALSGLSGVQSILAETGIYGAAISGLQEVSERIDAANVQAAKDPFQDGSETQVTTVKNAVGDARKSKSNSLTASINAAKSAAVTATNGTADKTAERAAGQAVQAAADAIAAANTAFRDGDPSQIQSAYNSAASAQAAAQAAYDKADSNHKAAAAAVLNAANQTLAVAQSLVDARNSPAGKLAGVTPSVSDLGNGYALSTWGNTGYVTITDASGKGVIISPNGAVDPIDGSGKGWKFNNTGTFILPGDTKVTINPGSPADILVSRGVHAFTVGNLDQGTSPVTSDYTSLNGRAKDRASNDGYIFSLGSDAAHWSLSGSSLGDGSSREVVATTPLQNELKLDPTGVAISAELRAFLESQIGLEGLDYDGDGKLNNVELSEIASRTANLVQSLQASYEQALANLAQANHALDDLNVLLDLVRKQNDHFLEKKADDDATTRAELRSVEQRLVQALKTLRGSGTPGLQGGIENGAAGVLRQLNNFTQQGGLPSSQQTTTPVQNLPSAANTAPSELPQDGLRRAGRLLGGILGGTNLNILDLPQGNQVSAPATVATAAASTATAQGSAFPLLDRLASELKNLAVQLAPLVPTNFGDVGTDLNQQNVSAGLEGLVATLSGLGLVDPSTLQNTAALPEFLQKLGQALTGSTGLFSAQVGIGNGTPAAASLLSFLGTLAQFGSALAAVVPQATLTTPGELENASIASLAPLSLTAQQVLEVLKGTAQLGSAGQEQGSGGRDHATGTLAQLSRAAEQLQSVLAGLAALGSAGAAQSSGNEGAKIPASADLRLGLRSFLLALSAFGIFDVNSQRDQTDASTIRTGGSSPSRYGATIDNANRPPSIDEGGGSIGTVVSAPTFQTPNTAAIKTISGNFQTDPALQKIIRENLSKALQTQKEQLSRAATLFDHSQQIVQRFVSLVKEDDLLRDVIKSDDLSDDQQVLFDERMKALRKDWGIDWGTTENDGPSTSTNLASRAVQSGMMV